MATRTRKTTTAKKTTTRKPAAKRTAPAPDTKPGTVVHLRPPLAVRRPSAATPYTPDQFTEARAALASATAQLPIPVLAWTVPTQATSRRATAHLTDGTTITHVAHRNPVFTAHIPCRTGATHQATITTAEQLANARRTAATCRIQHASDSLHQALTDGVHQPKISPLHQGLHRANAAAADTQPIPVQDIAAGLAARAADTETPKEHPEP